MFTLGLHEEGPPCLSLGVMVDSCATLNIMHFNLVKWIAKNFPHCVAAIYTNKSYHPIYLSGIAQVGDKTVSTLLRVAFFFCTQYRTRDGSPINMIFVLACGPDFVVNAIVGLPLLRSTGTAIDLDMVML